MKNKLKFSNEPVAYIGLAIIVLQIIQAIYEGKPIDGLADSLLTVGGTVLTRQMVTPTVGHSVVIYRDRKKLKKQENPDA